MNHREKLFEKLKRNPKDVSFHEFETLLGQFGFNRIKTNAGSHFKWKHPNLKTHIRAPYRHRMKPVYVQRLIRLIQYYFNPH